MRILYFVPLLLGLAGCAATATKPNATHDRIKAEMDQATAEKPKPAAPAAVNSALLPPLQVEIPKTAAKPLEQRFDLVVNNAPANQVFMGIVSGTRYSMLVHPDITGAISVNLKDVTVFEALDSIRELYGYDYKVEGTRIFIQSLGLQTRVIQVNYLASQRKGTSDIRVTSGSVSDAPSGGSGTTSGAASTSHAIESSRISTSSNSDFWGELKTALSAIVGDKEGRSVVVSPQSGVIVIRAMPEELKNVSAYLKASQLAVDRQVMLEAKIIQVVLNDGYQAGINWAAFKTGPNSRFTAGQAAPGTVLGPNGALATGATAVTTNPSTGAVTLANPLLSSLPGSDLLTDTRNLGSLFGLAFQTSNFAALLNFLETQGDVQVLSSPRIATLNNQKAVLKVGTDDFFVTNITTTTSSTGTTSTIAPTITVQPFFSGIALDVTPQIDENNLITLHIHPSVSVVTEKTKNLDLGSLGAFKLPLASSDISESDTVVRVEGSNIVAIGGLMKQQQSQGHSQLPGLGDLPFVGNAFRNTNNSALKSELVILLKPTIIQDEKSWQQDLLDTRERLHTLERRESAASGGGNR
jgi:MSHA biogenesis protein MshL